MIEVMLTPLAAALVLVGIHGYLGVHIIARGVIFVDLALAQVAALGWTAATFGLGASLAGAVGISPDLAEYAVGLAATLVAAAVFSVSRVRHEYITQEAIIGIVYVVASAATILLAAQAPRGAQHVEEVLTGSLLWVTWPTVLKTAAIYAVIGAIHWVFRDRFLTISLDPDRARDEGWSIRWWDFLFYALFGVVVTSSVTVAGVLLVFTFLVVPAVIAFLFTHRPGALLAIAWSTGTAATVLGLVVSYESDLPTGPLVICAFALALLVAFGLRRLAPSLGHEAAPAGEGGTDDGGARS